MTTERELAGNYDEVALLLNYSGEAGQEVAETLDAVAEEADENGLTPDEKKREMLTCLREIAGANTALAQRAAGILDVGYDAGGR